MRTSRWWIGAGALTTAGLGVAMATAACAKLLGTDDCSVTGCPTTATCTLVRGAAECVANPVVPPMVDAGTGTGTGTGSGNGIPDGGKPMFGYGSAPAFPPGDGSACLAAPGAAPSPTCDPSAEQGCAMFAGNGCVIDPKCNGGDPACEAFTKNSGSVQNFRLRLLNITAPPVLASNSTGPSFIQSGVITKAIDLPSTPNNCGENGQGLFNWLLSVDTVNKTVKTGGAPFSTDPFELGYCYFNSTVSGLLIAPVTSPATFTGNSFSTEPLKDKLYIPIFQDTMNPKDYTNVVILPLSGAYFHDVTVSNEGNCIGSVNNGALQAGSCTDPAGSGPNSCTRWHTAGAFAGYITADDADKVEVTLLGESLCSLLTSTNDGSSPFGKCTAAGKTMGDYCSNPVGGSCTDSFWLSANFAASAVNIDNSGTIPVCPASKDGG